MISADTLGAMLARLEPTATVSTYQMGRHFGAYLSFGGNPPIQIGFTGAETDDPDEFRELVQAAVYGRLAKIEALDAADAACSH